MMDMSMQEELNSNHKFFILNFFIRNYLDTKPTSYYNMQTYFIFSGNHHEPSSGPGAAGAVYLGGLHLSAHVERRCWFHREYGAGREQPWQTG